MKLGFLLIDTYIKDLTLKDKLLNAIETIPSVNKKVNKNLKWISDTSDFNKRVIAFIVEGIFAWAFCSILVKEKRYYAWIIIVMN